LKNSATTLKEKESAIRIDAVTHLLTNYKALFRLTAKEIDGKPNPIDHLIVTDSALGVHVRAKHLPKENQDRLTILPTYPLIQYALTF